MYNETATALLNNNDYNGVFKSLLQSPSGCSNKHFIPRFNDIYFKNDSLATEGALNRYII